VVAGFSGHGFMHGPICGQLMAEVVLDGQASTLDIGSLALSLFDAPPEQVEYNVV
jgi:sarcosine oxidase subunit beta